LPPHPPHLIAAFAAAAGLGVCKCFKNTQRGLQQQQKQLIFHQFCSGKNKQPQENNHRNDNTFFYYYGRYQFFVPPPHPADSITAAGLPARAKKNCALS
jgi:hypothetical protein